MADIYIGNVKGPQGATGETGAQGPQGDAATISVGTVSTTDYGGTADVTNVGTPQNAIFDFVIPQGKPGEETTTMSSLTLDTVTAQSAQYPVPATGETGSVVFGKIIKFFNDVKSAIVNKINYSDCVYSLTSNSNTLPLAASQGKALNDAIAPPTTESMLWGDIASSDHNKREFNVSSYKYVRVRVVFANAGAAEAVIPGSYFGSATTGTIINLHNANPDSSNYYGIMQIVVSPTGINIASEAHGSGVGAIKLYIYGAR